MGLPHLKWERILLVVLIIGGAVALFAWFFPVQIKEPETALDFSSGVSVNGEVIGRQEIESVFEKIPAYARGEVTRVEVAEGLLGRELLLQEAERKGVTATDEEIESYLSQLKSASSLDDADLEQRLSEMGTALEEYKENLREMFTVSKLLTQELGIQNVRVTEAEVSSYLQENQEEFQDIFAEGDPELQQLFKARLQQKLTLEKQQEIIQGYLETLKRNAQIEQL